MSTTPIATDPSPIAARVIAKCGGAVVVAGWLGIADSVVRRWSYARSRGGTGGFVPAKHQHALLVCARAAGVDLAPADFFDIAAISGGDTPGADGSAGEPVQEAADKPPGDARVGGGHGVIMRASGGERNSDSLS